ncbi:MAG: hypothetical protein EBU14_13165 [Acetobacteraceae bacterium]|nr:hypothetical protein [Acetobacteraceae bacterium]
MRDVHVGRLVVAGLIEDEEFGFRPPVGDVADLGADRILTLNVAESEAYLAAEVARWEALLKR